MTDKLPTYLATVLPGLEPVLADEILAKESGASVAEVLRGKVLFHFPEWYEGLARLRTADNTYLLLTRFQVGPHRAHVPALQQAISAVDVTAKAHEAEIELPKQAAVYVNASRVGKQSYSRFEAADAALAGLLERQRNWRLGSADKHDLEFRLDILDQEALFSLRLSPPSWRFRGEMRAFARAALRPTVAHALVWLSRPTAGDVVVDPFCGSGTIVAERSFYPAWHLIGGDLSSEAVAAARHNLDGAPIFRWDARRLPLRAGSVDSILTNLPFGHQIASAADIGELYRAFFGEVSRVLAGQGSAVVLTDQDSALERAVDAAGLAMESVATVSLKGLHPRVWRVTRKG